MDPNLQEERGGRGALVGAIIVILLLILGGAYVLTNKQANNGGMATSTGTASGTEEVGAAQTFDQIDQAAQAEADSLDKDLSDIDKEYGL